MKKSSAAEKYLERLDDNQHAQLEKIRNFIFKVLPEVQESMYYKMPTYHLTEKICSIAAQKNFIAVYIMQHELIENYYDDFSHLDVGKSCIRFQSIEDFPFEAFENILLESAEALKD